VLAIFGLSGTLNLGGTEYLRVTLNIWSTASLDSSVWCKCVMSKLPLKNRPLPDLWPAASLGSVGAMIVKDFCSKPATPPNDTTADTRGNAHADKGRPMLSSSPASRIFLYTNATPMQKSFAVLCAREGRRRLFGLPKTPSKKATGGSAPAEVRRPASLANGCLLRNLTAPMGLEQR